MVYIRRQYGNAQTAAIGNSSNSVGMLLFGWLGADEMHIKNAALLGNALGGLIFGIGMALLGYCPGTGIAAIGDGSRHAIIGVLGMIVGAGIYAEVHPWMQSKILGIGDYGKTTLADAAGISPWWFILALVIIAIIVFVALERGQRGSSKPT